MSYCTITDVRGLNPTRSYGASTTPTETQVTTYIDNIAGEIDAIINGRGYTVPVTAPTALVTFLKQTNALGAAALAESAMFPEPQGMGASTHGTDLWKKYQDALKWLREGDLPSEGSGGEADIPFSFAEQNIGTTSEPEETHDWQKPKFGINKDF
jgi:hypothetical protein